MLTLEKILKTIQASYFCITFGSGASFFFFLIKTYVIHAE